MGVAISEGIRFDREKNDDAQKKLKMKDSAAIATVACLLFTNAKPPAIASIANNIPIPTNAVGRRPARSITKGAAIVPTSVQQDAIIVKEKASPMPRSIRKTVLYVVDRMTPETWFREKKEPAVRVR